MEAVDDFELYELRESNGKIHSALRVPNSLPSHYGSEAAHATSDIFNILMADISGSMWDFWPHIVTGWQQSIKDRLTGRTSIYAFGDKILLKREGTDLTQDDFTGDGTNDLTGGLRTVRQKVEECPESTVRVFIIADGAHDHGEPFPETEICQMRAPPGKTVNVYVLGLGHGFPVQHSIDIRSQLHNGNANVPYLFWAKDSNEIVDQIAAIGEELNSSLIKLKLNLEGCILPGLEKTSVIHLGEWLYFEQSAEELPPMSLSINDDAPVVMSVKSKPSSMRLLLDGVFRQWNSVMIQQHRRKSHVPHETFDLMESMFSYFWDIMKQVLPSGTDIKSRLNKKNMKSNEVEFRTLMNQSKSLINIEQKFRNELDLAEAVLKTTVTNRKYDTKNLKLRGHTQGDFDEDMKSFKKLYEKAKPAIMALPAPSPEECCRVMITSTLTDLQDPDFHMMFDEDKFDFMKSFTMTGIPVLAPVRDASQINPWVMGIKHILVTPFTLLSQMVLEESAADTGSLGNENKDVILQKDNEKTRFNAIVPIVPATAAEVLKPLVHSNLYAMMTTFCIMKNPHVVDFNAHLAALGCVWMRTIGEFPLEGRPEFVRDRLDNVVATAKLYMDRPSIKHYLGALINQPKQALMTESNELYDGKTIKCESLVKPTFLAYLNKGKMGQKSSSDLFEILLFEFIGRCLSNYKMDDSEASPFTEFFCMELSDPEKKKAWLDKYCKTIIEAFRASQGNILEKFFTLDDLVPSLKEFVAVQVAAICDNILEEVSIGVDMSKVKKLKSLGSCGEVRWSSLQAWAQEMGMAEEAIQEASSPALVQVYVSESLQVRNSRDRLSRELPHADSALEFIKKKVAQENARTLRRTLLKEVVELATKQWREAYLTTHRSLVMPLTAQQVVEEARDRGINVTQETFNQVYRYDDRLRLLRNACQIVDCPHYLQPHNNFNQHLSVERDQGNFPHSLHLVSHEFCSQGINRVVENVVSGKLAGTKNRKPPPPPESTSLEYLSDQIETLLKVYSDNSNPSCIQGSRPKDNVNDDEEEEFYDCSS